MKLIFAGTPDFAAASLQAILDQGHDVVAVYTQPDRPAGRGKKIIKSAVKQVAEAHQLPVEQPVNFKDDHSLAQLQAYEADLMIVAAYGIILPTSVLTTPRLGCVNIHASILPRWRGAAPIQRAIAAGDSETGITIMQMDEGLDTGDMLHVLRTPIAADDTGGTLHDRLAELGARAILDYLAAPGDMTPHAQDNAQATYAHKLSKAEAAIDWQQDATDISRQVRAFNPWPVSYCHDQGATIRIFEAEALTTDHQVAAGTVLRKHRDGVDIACGKGALRVRRLQLPGAKAMSVGDFVNGGKALLGEGNVLADTASA